MNLFSLYLLVYQGSGSLVYSIMFDFHTILNLIYEIIVRVYYALVCLYRFFGNVCTPVHDN